MRMVDSIMIKHSRVDLCKIQLIADGILHIAIKHDLNFLNEILNYFIEAVRVFDYDSHIHLAHSNYCYMVNYPNVTSSHNLNNYLSIFIDYRIINYYDALKGNIDVNQSS